MKHGSSDGFDRIGILLIDDKPSGPRGLLIPRALPDRYASWFDFRWLATPEECREFRDLSWLIAQNDPLRLGTVGWIPEILAVDYRLMEERLSVQDRTGLADLECGRELSPLPALRKAAASWSNAIVGGKIPHRRSDLPEYWGCFAGGLILATLADYPCAPVTITAYDLASQPGQSPDTEVFEWLMATQSGGLLQGRGQGQKGVTWDDIIKLGIDRLRQRIRALAQVGIIALRLDELARLASGNPQAVITLTSRYGTRRLPVQGLFIDDPKQAVSWAEKTLQLLVTPGKWNALTEAWDHADGLLAKHDQENLVWERIELSNLLRRKEKGDALSPEDDQRLEALKGVFNAVVTEVTNKKGKTLINGEIQNERLVADIRHLQIDDWTRKWTALIVMLKLLKRFAVGWRNGMPFEEITEPEIYLALCPVARNPIILPFSEGSNRSIATHMQDVDRKVGFRVKDVLSGRGLAASERTLLKHVATTLGLGRDLWEEFPRIGRIVKGEADNA